MTAARRAFLAFLTVLAAACGGAGGASQDLSDWQPPRVSGKADSLDAVMRPRVAYGQRVEDTLTAAEALYCFPLESRDGATLSIEVGGIEGGKALLYGPLDADADYGPPLAVADATDGVARVEAALIEDGAYLACAAGPVADVAYSLAVACGGECGTDAALLAVRVNEMTAEELAAHGGLDAGQAQALAAKRAEVGLFSTVGDAAGAAGIGDAAAAEALLSLEWTRFFVSPKAADGSGSGLAPVNVGKTAPLVQGDGTVTHEKGDIVVPVVDLFERAATSIDLVMYSFSSQGAELQAIRNAVRRGVEVRAILDVSSGSPSPYNQSAIDRLAAAGAEVRMPKPKSRVLHQKFAVVDGVHVFNGSANFSSKSSSVYAENRFFFQFRPEVADAFRAEWDRQWDKLSQPAKLTRGGTP